MSRRVAMSVALGSLALFFGLASQAFGAAFVSTGTGGNWSALASWQSQDGAKPSRVPGDGDVATINGTVTVDVATTVGIGTGDAIVISPSAKIGDIKLVVASPLTVKGGIKNAGQSVIDVEAGAGIELDGAAGVIPSIHAGADSSMHLYFHGTEAKRCYLRTKVGTAGKPGRVVPDKAKTPIPCNVGASYTDFSDLGGRDNPAPSDGPSNTYWGLAVSPAAGALLKSLDHCTFTRTGVSIDAAEVEFSLSNSIFKGTPLTASGSTWCGVALGRLNVEQCGFDQVVRMLQVNNVTSNVFLQPFTMYVGGKKLCASWSDNLVRVVDPIRTATTGGQIAIYPATYERSYWVCTQNELSIPHVMVSYPAGKRVFDQCIWDYPFARNVDYTLTDGSHDVTVQRCVVLPRVGAARAGCGIPLGFVGDKVSTTYQHNTIAAGDAPALATSGTHGDAAITGGIKEFKNSLVYTLDAVTTPGTIFDSAPAPKDLVRVADCDYNGLYRTTYGADKPAGAHDVNGDPKFVDPTRNLMRFYRTQPGVKAGKDAADYDLALDWIYRHPEKMPAMIDWVRAGFAPTNIAYKAASDPDGPTKGWIGAVEGKEPEKK